MNVCEKCRQKERLGSHFFLLSSSPSPLLSHSHADAADARINWSPLLFLKIAFRILRPNNCTTSSPGREMIGSASDEKKRKSSREHETTVRGEERKHTHKNAGDDEAGDTLQ